MLSPAELGEYGLLTASLAFALLAVGLEFYSYTLREMVPATPAGRIRIIADQITLGAIALLAVGVLLLVAVLWGLFPARLAPWFLLILITEHISLEATRILIITWHSIRAYIGVFFRGGIWVYAMTVLMFTTPSTRTLEIVLIWWAAGGVLSIVFSALSLLDLPWCVLKDYRPDRNTIRGGLRIARPFLLTAGGALVISYVDRFFIDSFVGREALGIYTFYSTISIGMLSLGASISHQFLPKVIAGYAAGVKAYQSTVHSFFWSLFVIGSGAAISSGVLMGPLLKLLELPIYTSYLWVFYAMLPGVFLRILADVPSYALYAARADKGLMFCNLGAALMSVVLNLAFIPVLGIYGAALAGSIASGTLLLSLVFLASRRIRGDREPVPPVASAGFPTDPDMLYP
jgi:O-antigen/teichoic acid export membrane protein